jgi:hypothetical protein
MNHFNSIYIYISVYNCIYLYISVYISIIFVCCQGNVTSEDGRLAVLPGTHTLKGYNQPSRPGLVKQKKQQK